jgi:hypothetical protein
MGQHVSLTDARLLLLHPDDLVLVARQRITTGEAVVIEGEARVLTADLPIGHKLARRAILPNAPVLKYGAPIGRATRPIAAGEWVHTHNLKSDYTPTYTLDTAQDGTR